MGRSLQQTDVDQPKALFSKWSVPVLGLIPLNLALGVDGIVWFTAANSNIQHFHLGKLDPKQNSVTIWKTLVGIRKIHYLDRDANGNIWYLTTYADETGVVPDVLGRYGPGRGSIR